MCLNNYNNKYKSETWKVFPSVFPIPMTIFWPRSKILQQPVWWMWKKIMEACLIEAVPNKGKCKRRRKKKRFIFYFCCHQWLWFLILFFHPIFLCLFSIPFFYCIYILYSIIIQNKRNYIYTMGGNISIYLIMNSVLFFLKSDLKIDITTVIIIDRCKFVNF